MVRSTSHPIRRSRSDVNLRLRVGPTYWNPFNELCRHGQNGRHFTFIIIVLIELSIISTASFLHDLFLVGHIRSGLFPVPPYFVPYRRRLITITYDHV